ncbi:hypothetical protein AM493_08065 [Flavobacterium akiainvivens]|uniref:Fibronectin type-III domain-containing protein n=1 Tax=Flavobacterium akiainvivens TaxID=1202724 RepID=A0A0M9VJY4_9FLAO|nr:hypothetical protein AM493_08065 [Flavobacterium akiainvivens]
MLASCGSDDGGNDGGGGNGTAAALAAPLNNTECITGTEVNETQSKVTFEWNEAADNQTYFLYVKNLVTQNTLQYNAANNTSYEVTLSKATPYSWYVSSRKNSGNTVQSEVWKFYNAGPGITNYAPFPAELVAPVMSSSVYGPSLTLQWTGSDLDNDIESYEVFFGTAANPTTSIHTGTQTSVNNVAVVSGSTYYWKVVTTDVAGNATASPVFQFKVL